MVNLKKDEFLKIKENGIGFSLISSFRGDDLTPINIYKGLEKEDRFIFESGSKDEHFGRYSFLGDVKAFSISGRDNDELDEINHMIEKDFLKDSNPFPFKGGAVGYISYDMVAEYEKKLEFKNKKDLEIENFKFNFYDEYICYDAFTHKINFITNIFNGDEREYEEVLKEQREKFLKIKKNILRDFLIIEEEEKRGDFIEKSSMTESEFIEGVNKAKNHIVEGDIFQVVLSIRKYIKTRKTDFEIYRRLREENPSPYMFLLGYKDFSLIGSSPESLVSVKDGVIRTNPIAGTRRRGKSLEEDIALSIDLLEDEKERAEHVMLVDLGRNDIGKVSKFQSVKVEEFMKVEKFSHVMHITSRVRGEIKENSKALDALKACMPAGTVSGAPKIRAMEIIEDIEKIKREFYAGTVGYFSYGDNMDMSIAIRTILLKNGIASIQAGAGIVHDSVPKKEYEEIENKLRILKEVLR